MMANMRHIGMMICHLKPITIATICQYASFSEHVYVYSIREERNRIRFLFSLFYIYFILDILGISYLRHVFFCGISVAYRWHNAA